MRHSPVPNRQETITADPQQWIAAENVARFEEQLAKEMDPDKRRTLKELLTQERRRVPHPDAHRK